MIEILALIVIGSLGILLLIPADRVELEMLKDMFKSKKRIKKEKEMLDNQLKAFWETHGTQIYKRTWSTKKEGEL